MLIVVILCILFIIYKVCNMRYFNILFEMVLIILGINMFIF